MFRLQPEIIRFRGYPVEIHQVITADDYILEMHRIPHSKSGATLTVGRPVYIQHG
jgi:lysosomal acid lipase/cholesteryl ester hydrolase